MLLKDAAPELVTFPPIKLVAVIGPLNIEPDAAVTDNVSVAVFCNKTGLESVPNRKRSESLVLVLPSLTLLIPRISASKIRSPVSVVPIVRSKAPVFVTRPVLPPNVMSPPGVISPTVVIAALKAAGDAVTDNVPPAVFCSETVPIAVPNSNVSEEVLSTL